MRFALLPLISGFILLACARAGESAAATRPVTTTAVLRGDEPGPRFDGIGVVDGGGATSVLLKDYPEPQRSQILDLVFRPKFGASVSALLVEIPGDGNSTQGSMPSQMHTRDDRDFTRGYTWWILREARHRNPALTLDGTAWSAPGWVGNGNFWSQDAADYYVTWLEGLRRVYGLELDALGCRNEKGVSFDFAKRLRAALDARGFRRVLIHAFDNWPANKFDFVPALATDPELREAIGIVSAHTLAENPASPEVRRIAAELHKPIWNTEEHVYKKGFDCAISIVRAFNENFLRSGATKVVNWYGIAALYPLEPYSEDPAMLLARSPWSGHYQVREALWGYAHYGQFTAVGWHYLPEGCRELPAGGSVVTLKSPGDDFTIIAETQAATAPQTLRFGIGRGLSRHALCVWRSNAQEQFVRLPDVASTDGEVTVRLEPHSIYSVSTTTGQQKGSFGAIPAAQPFPFPYRESFDEYTMPAQWGHLPHYTADIAGVFELAARLDHPGTCLRQVVPIPPLAWAPEWQPYTILGDDQWRDYDVSIDVFLNPHDTAGVIGRVNHVGTGYGSIPKGYFLELSADGGCRLVVVRGQPDKKKAGGDAEQQALLKAGRDDSEGGEKVLGTAWIAGVGPRQWHTLKLRFVADAITGFVDGRPVLRATDRLYPHGMAGLLAGAARNRLSTPYYDNLTITAPGAEPPATRTAFLAGPPIYGR